MSAHAPSRPDGGDPDYSDDDDDDSLGVARLSLDFEALVDRIAQRVQDLAQQALQSAHDQQALIFTPPTGPPPRSSSTRSSSSSSSSSTAPHPGNSVPLPAGKAGVACAADTELATLRDLLRQCDAFDLDFQKMAQLAGIVGEFRARVDRAERLLLGDSQALLLRRANTRAGYLG